MQSDGKIVQIAKVNDEGFPRLASHSLAARCSLDPSYATEFKRRKRLLAVYILAREIFFPHTDEISQRSIMRGDKEKGKVALRA